mmetsp:Transcript_153550/g.270997  ORF Transcript_153550/g.270997 Transcript_153550/m.270997 type:complete len:232 (-) Transcript_153550:633-1328(-)
MILEASGIVPQPALLGAARARLTDPVLALGVVSAFCAAVSIQLIVVAAADKGVGSLGASELFEACLAFVVHECVSAWLRDLESSTAVDIRVLVPAEANVGITGHPSVPPQPTIPETGIATSCTSLADPILTEDVVPAQLAALSINCCITQSAHPVQFNLISSPILKGCLTWDNDICAAAQWIPCSTLSITVRGSESTILPQIAELGVRTSVCYSRVIHFAHPKLTIWIFLA